MLRRVRRLRRARPFFEDDEFVAMQCALALLRLLLCTTRPRSAPTRPAAAARARPAGAAADAAAAALSGSRR